MNNINKTCIDIINAERELSNATYLFRKSCDNAMKYIKEIYDSAIDSGLGEYQATVLANTYWINLYCPSKDK